MPEWARVIVPAILFASLFRVILAHFVPLFVQ
jgi:hypothetical protein